MNQLNQLQQLRAFPERYLKDLSSLFQKIDWRNLKAALFAKAILERELSTILRFVERWASNQSISAEQLWRNLIACSSKSDVDYYWLPLRFSERQGRHLLGKRQNEILPMLPPPGEIVAPMLQLLEPSPEVNEDMVRVFAPRQRAARWESFNRYLLETSRPTTLSYVTSLISKSAQIFGDKGGPRALNSVVKSLEAQRAARKLSMPVFLKLSQEFRRDILNSRRLQEGLLNKQAQRKIQTILEQAKSLGIKNKVPFPEDTLSAIAKGHLNSPVIIHGFEIWDIADKEVSNAIRKASTFSPSTALTDWLGTKASSDAMIALRLVATPVDQWSSYLGAVNARTLSNVTGIVGPRKILKTLILNRLTLTHAQQIKSTPELSNLSGDVLLELINSIGHWSGQHDLPAAREHFSNLFSAILLLIKIGVINDKAQSDLEQGIKRLARESSDDKLLCGLIQPKILAEISDSSGRPRSFGIWLIKQFRSIASGSEVLESNYRSLFSRHGDLLLKAAGTDLTPEEIDLLVKGNHSKNILSQLSNRVFRQSMKHWESYLFECSKDNKRLPRKIYRAISSDLVWLEEVYRQYPELMVDSDLNKLPLPVILANAFKCRTLGQKIDKHVSRKRLASAHDWINSEYAAKPRVQAAYQLAIEYGVRFAPFLVSLAMRLPEARENEGRAFADLYHTYKLPKKSGGARTITVPSDHLKALQRAILRNGFQALDTGPHAFGFRKGKSIVDNAKMHVRSDMVVNVDIQSFFPSTKFASIRRVCKDLAYGRLSPMAQWLAAEICSYQGGLPTGAPTSPAIANIVLKHADHAIDSVCRKRKIRYSRYADDLTFSGSANVTQVLPFVTRVLGELGYQLEESKTNIFRKGRRQIVTGLVVNEAPNIARPLRRKLRAAVYNRAKGMQPHWHGNPISDRELMGRIAFLGQVQPEEAIRLRSALKSAMRPD